MVHEGLWIFRGWPNIYIELRFRRRLRSKYNECITPLIRGCIKRPREAPGTLLQLQWVLSGSAEPVASKSPNVRASKFQV